MHLTADAPAVRPRGFLQSRTTQDRSHDSAGERNKLVKRYSTEKVTPSQAFGERRCALLGRRRAEGGTALARRTPRPPHGVGGCTNPRRLRREDPENHGPLTTGKTPGTNSHCSSLSFPSALT